MNHKVVFLNKLKNIEKLNIEHEFTSFIEGECIYGYRKPAEYLQKGLLLAAGLFK